MWKTGQRTFISHIDVEISEVGMSLRVSYIGLAISELDEPCSTLTGM